MLVSHNYKFIFLKSIKTASTSAFVFFAPYCLPKNLIKNYKFEFSSQEKYVGNYKEGMVGKIDRNPKTNRIIFKKKHVVAANAKTILDNIDEKIWKNYFKFTIVRNPWDLMVSLYFHKLKYFPIEMKDVNFDNFIKSLYYKKYVEGYLFYKINEKYVCDYHIRYEHLYEGIKHVCKKANIIHYDLNNFKKFRSDSRPKGLNYKTMYKNKKTKKMVEELYESDIQKFKYVF